MKLRPACIVVILMSLGISAIAGAQSSADAGSRDNSKDLVGVGHDTTLPSGHEADSVVSILGTTRVSGHDRSDAVAVLGDVIVDGKVDGDVVAVVGDVTLAPTAEVGGDVVTLLGTLQRDPAALVNGSIHSIFDRDFGPFSRLRAWIKNCVLYARPLAFAPGLAWAWGLALGFLALYASLALLLPGAVRHCVHTFDEYPGHSLLAAFIAILLTPVLFLLLGITIIGIPAIPFVATGLLCAGIFGKAVILAWIGSRILGSRLFGGRNFESAAFFPLAVLVGGAVMLLVYVIPVLGLLAFQLLGVLGLGAVIYSILLLLRSHRTPPHLAEPLTGPQPSAASTAGAPAPEPTVSPVSPDLPRAGFWIRMAALFLDAVLIGFITSLLHHAFFVLLAVYGAVMWKLRGATLGGIIFDLKVARLDGQPMNWETAIVRALGCFLSLAVAGLGFIWIAFDGGKQAWHDKIAGTAVVRLPAAVVRVPG